MLAQAAGYDALVQADIAAWTGRAALIFSNAALHWLGDHAALMPQLAAMLVPDGVLAVQMPRQYGEPSHRLLREVAEGLGRPTRQSKSEALSERSDPVARAEDYARLLAGLGEVAAWETVYIQRLGPAEGAHPVRLFTESTAMRPFVEGLDASALARFVRAYEERLEEAYPREADGSVLFPFRRVFFTLRVACQP